MKKKKPKQSRIDRAFLGSTSHTLSDLKLHPWTPERYLAGQNMGMLHPRIGNGAMDQFERTMMYPGCVKDVAIVMWLCSIPDSQKEDAKEFQWSVEDADARPIEAYKVAKKWAIGRGLLKPDSREFWEAYAQFSEMMKEARESITQPKGAPAGGSEEDGEDDLEGNG